MNQGMKVVIVIVLLAAACFYGYTKWKSLNPDIPKSTMTGPPRMPGMAPMAPGDAKAPAATPAK